MTRSPTLAAASPGACWAVACWAGAGEQAKDDTAAVRKSDLFMQAIILSPFFRLQSPPPSRQTFLCRRLFCQLLARADLETPEPRVRGHALHFHRVARTPIPFLHAGRSEQAN